MIHKHRFLIFIIVLLILGLIFSPILPVKEAILTVLAPITKTLNSTTQGGRGFFATIKSIKNLSRESKEAQTRIQELEAELARLKEVDHENQILKEELGFFRSEEEVVLIPAQITSKSTSAFLKNITINRGAKDGVTMAAAVISRGYLVGIISEVGENFSQVELITDPKTIVPVVLQESRGTGFLKANLKGLFVENLPVDIKVQKGEIVLTSNLGSILPPNLIIGQVSEVTFYESQIFQTVKISSPIEFSKLEMVFVIH